MISLFLDTSSKNLVVSIQKDQKSIYFKEIESINNHSEYLLNFINEGMNINSLSPNSIDKIFVVNGPGSFTGTRIAVTVAKTFAYAVNKNIIPVSSLKQFVFAYSGYDFYVSILEDRNNKIYYGIYDKDYNNIIDDCYSTIDELKEELNKLKGSILIISDKEFELAYKIVSKKLDIKKVIDYYKDKEENAFFIKPNYLKKIEAESKL